MCVAMCLALLRAAAEAGVLQCVAGCCNNSRCVWHCVAACCSVTVCVAIVLGCSGVCEVAFAHVLYAIIHLVYVCGTVWHCVAVCFREIVCVAIVLGCSGVCEVAFAHVSYAIIHLVCVLHCVARCCTVLQCVSVKKCELQLYLGVVVSVRLRLCCGVCVCGRVCDAT